MHEENTDALVLIEKIPPQFTPTSNNYVTTTIYPREEIFKRGIKTVNIDTFEHMGDLLQNYCLRQRSNNSERYL